MIVVLPLHADTIGDITELKGYGQKLRDEPYAATLDFNINSYDDVRTRAGRIGITLLDNSTVLCLPFASIIFTSKSIQFS